MDGGTAQSSTAQTAIENDNIIFEIPNETTVYNKGTFVASTIPLLTKPIIFADLRLQTTVIFLYSILMKYHHIVMIINIWLNKSY